jgi:hypothetical protein
MHDTLPARVPAPGRLILLLVLVGMGAPLAYTLFTRHTWEDFYITYRFSRNLCAGQGLVYEPGRRVHGFTSPLGVLLPALAFELTGRDDMALDLFRAVSIAAFAAACLLGAQAVFRATGSAAGMILFGLWSAVDAKSIAFSTNGMETAFMLLFLASAVYLMTAACPDRWLARGLLWSGLMWTRPDGCVFIACLVVMEMMMNAGSGERGARSVLFKSLAKSAVLAGLLYLPWFAWAWLYYGSPIPNTVRAKAPPDYWQYLATVAQHLPDYFIKRAQTVFTPIYAATFGGWPAWTGPMSVALSLGAFLYWTLPMGNRLGRAASASFALLMVYAMCISEFYPWYVPPLTWLATLTWVCAAAQWIGAPLAYVRWPVLAGLCAGCLASGYLSVMMARQMKMQQSIVEAEQRIPLGRWLAKNVPPNDRVYVECLGYLGYFSGRRMLDWPGLVSPEVVRLRREGYDLHTVVPVLEPEWVVLRPTEADHLMELTGMRDEYRHVETFDIRQRLNDLARTESSRFAKRSLPGAGYLHVDAVFLVFRRQPSTSR